MLANPQKTADLVTFTEEILNRKLHFLCSVWAPDESCAIHNDFLKPTQVLQKLSLLKNYRAIHKHTVICFMLCSLWSICCRINFFHQITRNKGNEKSCFLVKLLDPSMLKKVQQSDPVSIKEGRNLPSYSTLDIKQ